MTATAASAGNQTNILFRLSRLLTPLAANMFNKKSFYRQFILYRVTVFAYDRPSIKRRIINIISIRRGDRERLGRVKQTIGLLIVSFCLWSSHFEWIEVTSIERYLLTCSLARSLARLLALFVKHTRASELSSFWLSICGVSTEFCIQFLSPSSCTESLSWWKRGRSFSLQEKLENDWDGFIAGFKSLY